MDGSDERIISILNSGNVLFNRISQWDKKLQSLEQLYVRVTYRIGDQEGDRDIYLKGQVLFSDIQGTGSESWELNVPTNTPIPPIHGYGLNEQTEHQPEVPVPLLSNAMYFSAGDIPNESNIFGKTLSTRKRVFNQHLGLHIVEKPYKYSPYQCNQCDKGFLKKTFLNLHKRNKHGDIDSSKAYQCNHCDIAFIQKENFECHMQYYHWTGHSGERLFQCKKCNKIYLNNEEYMLHMFIHTGEKPYPCSQCDEAFLQNSDLKKHLERHAVTYNLRQPYQHKISEKAFKTKRKFEEHIKYNHLTDHTGERLYKCRHCNKAFSNNGEFMLHMFIHTGVRPHQCNLCNKSFLQNRDLKNHMETHMGRHLMEIYQCSLCDKAFKDKQNLEEHMVSHNGENPCQRNLCDNIFLRNSNLENHMNIHTRKRPCQCNHCRKDFYKTNALEKHIITHTGEKPYQCNECGKDVQQDNTLKGDIEIKNEENQNQCNQCQYGHSQERSLISHANMQTFEMLKSVNRIETDYLCEPKIEIKQEEIDS